MTEAASLGVTGVVLTPCSLPSTIANGAVSRVVISEEEVVVAGEESGGGSALRCGPYHLVAYRSSVTL